MYVSEEKVQVLKMALGMKCQQLHCLNLKAFKDGWPVLSLAVSSSHQQCMIGVLIIAELGRGESGAEIMTMITKTMIKIV